MKKRGQSSFEFLTTYGWAFLVLMIMIGALTSFGVLDVEKFLPEKCSFPPDIICEDYQIRGDTDEAKVKLRHNFGEEIILENLECEFDNGNTDTVPFGEVWKPKISKNATCQPSSKNFFPGTKEKIIITITYKLDQTGYDHHVEGELYANVI